MGLPDKKGTYVLITSVPQMKRIEIGQLGEFDIVPGFYAYVGSAFGSGGLRARIGQHLELTAAPHWHIDYLLQVAEPIEVWFTTATQRLEHHWADILENAFNFRVPIPRFGSSDYHRSRASHLFCSKRRPAFAWFRQQLSEKFANVHAERYVMAEVKSWICTTYGTQFASSVKPPHDCPICLDERQFVNWDGQEWMTLAQLQRSHQNLVKAQGPGITGIGTNSKADCLWLNQYGNHLIQRLE
jgi:Uri superfamily endonuclease